jgi:hypothetical protein
MSEKDSEPDIQPSRVNVAEVPIVLQNDSEFSATQF